MSRGLDDNEIKSKVRACLVKNSFDTSALNIGVHRGAVNVLGTLKSTASSLDVKIHQRIAEDPFMNNSSNNQENASSGENKPRVNTTDSTASKLMNVETEIVKISGVRSVNLDFHNYRKTAGVWKKKN
ncbi:MAG: hypothetical protein ACD_79C00068G0002 [uncultured bacterium]|nr:MAG: hypothetical protein ACD_79C00068G0002 [uncultured bacterium]